MLDDHPLPTVGTCRWLPGAGPRQGVRSGGRHRWSGGWSCCGPPGNGILVLDQVLGVIPAWLRDSPISDGLQSMDRPASRSGRRSPTALRALRRLDHDPPRAVPVRRRGRRARAAWPGGTACGSGSARCRARRGSGRTVHRGGRRRPRTPPSPGGGHGGS
jgi:hypothetical protein